MALDDRKRENVVNVRFTDRELLDLSRLAAVEDRKLAELVHFIVRSFMYGRVCPSDSEMEGADRASRP